jgi:endonuclease-3
MNPAKRLEIFTRFRAANPHPTTELEYTTPFELLIAVLLSAQSTDVGVNKATRRLYPIANTPQKSSTSASMSSRPISRPSACTTPRPRT